MCATWFWHVITLIVTVKVFILLQNITELHKVANLVVPVGVAPVMSQETATRELMLLCQWSMDMFSRTAISRKRKTKEKRRTKEKQLFLSQNVLPD